MPERTYSKDELGEAVMSVDTRYMLDWLELQTQSEAESNNKQHVLTWISATRSHIAAGRAHDAAFTALLAGFTGSRAGPAMDKMRSAAAQVGRQQDTKLKKNQHTWNEWQNYLDIYRRDNPRFGREKVRQAVADHFKVGRRVIEARTVWSDPLPPSE